MAEPEIVPTVSVIQVRAFFGVWRYRVEAQLSRGRVGQDGRQIASEVELVNVTPETAIGKIGNLGLLVDEEVRIDGVCFVERPRSRRRRRDDGAVIGPSAGKKRGRGSKTDGGDLGTELGDRVETVIRVAYFMDIRRPGRSVRSFSS